MPDLYILGGGPAGLALGFYAHRAGIPFTLFEKCESTGGLCRTLTLGKHRYDCGAHRLHDHDPEVTSDVRELLNGQIHPVKTPSSICDQGRFVVFPPTPVNFIASAGPRQLVKILAELARNRLRRGPRRSFSDFAIRGFGETLARRYLLNYSEKVWGLPADELSPAVSTRRLKGMTFRTLFFELFAPSRKSENIEGAFLYPSGGYGRIVEAMEAAVPACSVQKRHEVAGLEVVNGRVRSIAFADGSKAPVEGDVVSTLPLTLLARFLAPALGAELEEAAERLRFRSVRLFFLRLAQPRVTRNASLYFPDARYSFTRLSEPKNRCESMAPPDETGLNVEVPCFAGDALAEAPAEALFETVVRDLESTGLLKRQAILEWRHHFLPDAYPVYTLDYQQHVDVIVCALQRVKNLQALGRNGLFYYSHLHDQFRMAKDYVRRRQAETRFARENIEVQNLAQAGS